MSGRKGAIPEARAVEEEPLLPGKCTRFDLPSPRVADDLLPRNEFSV